MIRLMSGKTQEISGTFEPDKKAGGFLRTAARNYQTRPDDPRVPHEMVKRYGLQGGETVAGTGKVNGRGRSAQLQAVTRINNREPEAFLERTPFIELTAIDPSQPVMFETEGGPTTMRVVDLMTPIGFGQRGLIVAPPRTGKTVLLQQMAAGLAANHPDVYMMVLLIDERPEEVTEMRRTVHGEVVASSNDHDAASHVRIARLMIEKAKRHVECGEDVFVLLDSLTRLGRAFNAFVRGSGRIMSGGLDSRALTEPKSIFGAARKLEEGGSLTIIASALIETGSRMDEVIFNEFKGTGNMEIMLSRDLANKRIWPAIDLDRSGTRKEELLLSPTALACSQRIRRVLAGRPPDQAMVQILENLNKHPTNEAFLSALPQVAR
jgi:transcription termination factor Rho